MVVRYDGRGNMVRVSAFRVGKTEQREFTIIVNSEKQLYQR